MAKESLDIVNLIDFFTIPSSLEAWLCDKHLRSYLRSFRSYFTHPDGNHTQRVSQTGMKEFEEAVLRCRWRSFSARQA
jgi:hypothetical protein